MSVISRIFSVRSGDMLTCAVCAIDCIGEESSSVYCCSGLVMASGQDI